MPRLLTALVLLLALAATGCGGSNGGESREAYGKDLGKAVQTVQKSFAELGAQATGRTSAQAIADRFARGAVALDDAAKRFQAIKPPSDVADAHRKLIEGFRELAADFRKSADAARRQNTKRLLETVQGIASSDGAKKITDAQRELKEKGIAVTARGS